MTKSNVRSVPELVKAYAIDHKLHPAERLAHFLDLAASELPKSFVDKRYAAKIAFAQARTPGPESDWVKKKLSNVMSQTGKILKSQYGRDLFTDRVEGGVRATTDDKDIVVTTHRKKRRRILSAIDSFEQTDALVNPSKLSGAIKKELLEARKAKNALLDYKERSAGLLPVGKED